MSSSTRKKALKVLKCYLTCTPIIKYNLTEISGQYYLHNMYYGQLYFLLIAFVALAIPSHAKTIFVDDNASDGGDGTSWASAHKYLQDALAVAEYGDEIWVAEGTYKPDQGAGKTAGDRDASFRLVNGVAMFGGFKGKENLRTPLGHSSKTVLSGEVNNNFWMWSKNVVFGGKLDENCILDGFTITKGFAKTEELSDRNEQYGGGLYLSLASIKINDCIFVQNEAFSGGGIYMNQSSPIITHTIVLENSSVELGGGVMCSNSTPTFINCIFSNNFSTNGGGGIGNRRADPTLINCIFVKNRSASGSAVQNYSFSDPNFINCTIAMNKNAYGLGVVTNSNSAPTFTNCIIWNYGTQDDTDLIKSSTNLAIERVPVFTETNIIQGGAYYGTFYNDPRFLIGDNSYDFYGLFFANYDGLRLKKDSPAIDSGYNSAIAEDVSDLDEDGNKSERTPIDVVGFRRVQNGTVDIGAYEFGDSMMETHQVITSVSPEGYGLILGGNVFAEVGESVEISADPKQGFLFTGWSGDANGSTNPITITVDSAKSITANFVQDLNDTDGDGLSNFAELVTHGTKVDDNDTDNDGLLDNEEIQIGTDPNISDSDIINFFNSKATSDQDNARSAGQTAGISMVTSNTSAYNLVTQSAYDEMMNELMSASDTDTTPYSEGWFYLPNQGWLWTTRTTYPYFFDSTSKAWMYFQSGNEKPKFYHYGTKEWVTVE